MELEPSAFWMRVVVVMVVRRRSTADDDVERRKKPVTIVIMVYLDVVRKEPVADLRTCKQDKREARVDVMIMNASCCTSQRHYSSRRPAHRRKKAPRDTKR